MKTFKLAFYALVSLGCCIGLIAMTFFGWVPPPTLVASTSLLALSTACIARTWGTDMADSDD